MAMTYRVRPEHPRQSGVNSEPGSQGEREDPQIRRGTVGRSVMRALRCIKGPFPVAGCRERASDGLGGRAAPGEILKGALPPSLAPSLPSAAQRAARVPDSVMD